MGMNTGVILIHVYEKQILLHEIQYILRIVNFLQNLNELLAVFKQYRLELNAYSVYIIITLLMY